MCHLVAVRHPSALHLRRTFTNEQLQLTDERSVVHILGMSGASRGDTLVLADYNERVKALNTSTGTLTDIYTERTAEWSVSNVLLVRGDLRLLVTQTKGYSNEKRVLVATRETTADTFGSTHDITLEDDTIVRPL